MSERMSNSDIEDVLSSIRRLVSDDLRPGGGQVQPPTTALSAARGTVPRLVLTAALRVAPAPDRSAAVAHDGASPHSAAADGLVERLAELEALMASQNPQFEDELAPPVAELAVPEAPFIEADADLTATGPETAGLAYEGADPMAAPADPVQDPARLPDMDEDDPLPLQDEALLRALIRDVLREELQGAMGERVTRNLRKLIRAEIARALTARGIA